MQQNKLREDNLRLEIGTLVEDISDYELRNGTVGKFKITAIMPNATDDTIDIGSGNMGLKINPFAPTKIQSSEYIELPIPASLRMYYTALEAKIPAGTRFIVCFTGANLNDSRIIGLYDKEPDNKFIYTYYEMHLKIAQLVERIEDLETIHGIIFEGDLIGGELPNGESTTG